MNRSREEEAVLAAARRGDGDAFRLLIEPHRGALAGHCRRMLGSAADAEDAMQEVMLRAWRALPRFEARSSLRTWLYTIATNACLNAIERRPKHVVPVDYEPAADPHRRSGGHPTATLWPEAETDPVLGLTAPGPEAIESRYERSERVELALTTALTTLPPRQWAVLVLRDLLGLPAAEIAATLGTTRVSVNSALQRARATIARSLSEGGDAPSPLSPDDSRLREIVADYRGAIERDDLQALIGMIGEDHRSTERHWRYSPAAAY